MLLFRDPDRQDISLAGRLRMLFGLSKTEAEIAVELSKGRSPAEIMHARDVSANTLSTQLKSIMAKMNCKRQGQVAAVIAGLPEVRT